MGIEDQDDNEERTEPIGSKVLISTEELEQYQEFERWVLSYLKSNGRPCNTFRRRHPKFDEWWNSHQKNERRIKQQKQFDDELDRLLSKMEAKEIVVSREIAASILLETSSAKSKYSELLSVPPAPVGLDEVEDEDEDEEWV